MAQSASQLSPLHPETEFATQQTFTHERILYTLFVPFVNHILVRLAADPGFRLEKRRGGDVDHTAVLGRGAFNRGSLRG